VEVFEYKGRNRRGELMRGRIEAVSERAAAASLMGSDIFPVSITPPPKAAEQPEWFVRLTRQDRVPPEQVVLFTRQMANMVRAGLQILDAVSGIQATTENKPLAKVLGSVVEDLDRGMVLSAAFARHPRVFDDYYVNMIRFGEGSGRLEEAFRNLYQQLEFDRGMRRKIKSALRYPSFVMTAIGIAMAVVTIYVIPAFSKTYATMKVELPLITRMLVGVSNFAVSYWWLVLLLGIAAVVGIQMALKMPEVRYAWDRHKLRLPIIGPILYKGTVARFSRSFATAMKSDVPVVTVFQLVSKVVDNAFFEARILQMRSGVERGEVLSRVMRTSGIFSAVELQLITLAEKTGEVENAVDEIAQLYSEDVEYQVERLSTAIEPLLLAFLGVLVLVLVLGIFLPMWDLGQATLKR
jgi:MSHA biogenesis protein MshG